MKKENLILVHSFPTNSVLLKGLIDYFSSFFEIYFIDLPGFTTKVPASDKITLAHYSQFVDQKIAEFDLDHYLIGGISFGFLVINNAKLNRKCIGVLAVEPYINADSLKISLWQKYFVLTIINIINLLKLDQLIWHSKLFGWYLLKMGNPPQRIHHTFIQVDPRTFFQTAKLILTRRKQVIFHQLPYVLIINREDRTVDYDYLEQLFKAHVPKLLIINTQIEHFPVDLSVNYFKRMFPKSYIEKIYQFINSNNVG